MNVRGEYGGGIFLDYVHLESTPIIHTHPPTTAGGDEGGESCIPGVYFKQYLPVTNQAGYALVRTRSAPPTARFCADAISWSLFMSAV